ncbi:MAG: glycosyltransferase family 2 protein [Chryseobacterium sp.]|nr:MAG: glycosyltransferase family 2 protein [Chryseobacterium sp.]
MITIFTPAYNRADTLPRLYESLCRQQRFDFEWVIVDDGSTDNTSETVRGFGGDQNFPIIYHKQENGGKHRAINRGLILAKGELFIIVDSDDYLTDDATKLIEEQFEEIRDRADIAGVSFRRGFSSTDVIGTQNAFEDSVCNVFAFRYRMKIAGDMAEVYKTEVLRKYPFPEFEGEKFCPEALVWNRIGRDYDMLWTSQIVYICEYLEGGLTDRIVEIRKNSPTATLVHYAELEKANIPLYYKVRANINFWRFARHSKLDFGRKLGMVSPLHSIVGLPTGLLYSYLR